MSYRLASWIAACGLVACLPESANLDGYSRDWEPLDPSVEPFPELTGGANSVPTGGAAGAGASSTGTGGTEGSTTLPLSPPNDTGGSSDGSASAGGGAGSVEEPTGGSAGTTGSGGAEDPPPDELPTCDFGVLSPDERTCLSASITIASWQAARDACSAQQGNLAKVDSAAKDALIQTLISENAWLGGSDTITDNVFVWLDGSPITFGNWGANQPDRFPGADCIEKRASEGGFWYDQPCSNERVFVCEEPIQ